MPCSLAPDHLPLVYATLAAFYWPGDRLQNSFSGMRANGLLNSLANCSAMTDDVLLALPSSRGQSLDWLKRLRVLRCPVSRMSS